MYAGGGCSDTYVMWMWILQLGTYTYTIYLHSKLHEHLGYVWPMQSGSM